MAGCGTFGEEVIRSDMSWTRWGVFLGVNRLVWKMLYGMESSEPESESESEESVELMGSLKFVELDSMLYDFRMKANFKKSEC